MDAARVETADRADRGESASEAAARDLAAELRAARAEGRLIFDLALDVIDADHLIRDRIVRDSEAMASLKASLAERGQQAPIEVVDLGTGRYGLISGWRRLMALRELHDETGLENFGRVLALLRRPDGAADAYRAMVDENEIRVGLSYYERARIAARAAEHGVYPTPQIAIRSLFSTASRAKRSKIGSFLTVHAALDDALRYPCAIPERLGLALAKALQKAPHLASTLCAAVRAADPADAAAEQAVLARGIRTIRRPVDRPVAVGAKNGIQIERSGPDRLILSGPGLDVAFEQSLVAWLAQR